LVGVSQVFGVAPKAFSVSQKVLPVARKPFASGCETLAVSPKDSFIATKPLSGVPKLLAAMAKGLSMTDKPLECHFSA
jgi:hypothetical protein